MDNSYDVFNISGDYRNRDPLSTLGSNISYDLKNKNRFINSLPPRENQ